jgi:hypothetical protein
LRWADGDGGGLLMASTRWTTQHYRAMPGRGNIATGMIDSILQDVIFSFAVAVTAATIILLVAKYTKE